MVRVTLGLAHLKIRQKSGPRLLVVKLLESWLSSWLARYRLRHNVVYVSLRVSLSLEGKVATG
jgi:hypothetical protein